MSDPSLNYFLAYGTNAARLAFTPSPPVPAGGPDPLYIWFTTDTGDTYAYDTSWHLVGSGAGGGTFSGSGSPEGVVTGTPGNIYTDTSDPLHPVLYVKVSGIGNTGWFEMLAT